MPQLISLANNTKWNELQTIMSGLGIKAPYWRSMATNGYLYPPSGWDADWTYHFRLGEYKTIEWCELSPRGNPESITLDETITIIKQCGFEFEVGDDRVKIIAYVRRE
jgi:hypothetical protein